MFWGLSAGINLHNYNTNGTDHSGIDIKGGPAFDGALFFGMDFGLLIGQAEVLFTGDNAAITYPYPYPGEVDVTGISLMIPFILKVDFHLGPLVLQPLAGLYLNFGLGNLKESGMGADREDPYANPPLGLIFGGSLGTPLGRGIVFLDGRCAIDLGRTAAGNNPITIWKRSAFMINLGYQFFIGRRR
jgi:hypothetical protein